MEGPGLYLYWHIGQAGLRCHWSWAVTSSTVNFFLLFFWGGGQGVMVMEYANNLKGDTVK
jgi:hypothetical protein